MDFIMTAIAPQYSGEMVGKTPWTVIENDFEGALAEARSQKKYALINWTGYT